MRVAMDESVMVVWGGGVFLWCDRSGKEVELKFVWRSSCFRRVNTKSIHPNQPPSPTHTQRQPGLLTCYTYMRKFSPSLAWFQTSRFFYPIIAVLVITFCWFFAQQLLVGSNVKYYFLLNEAEESLLREARANVDLKQKLTSFDNFIKKYPEIYKTLSERYFSKDFTHSFPKKPQNSGSSSFYQGPARLHSQTSIRFLGYFPIGCGLSWLTWDENRKG